MAETIDKILDKLPYSDGSLRRRFVSGGIIIVGALVICLILWANKEDPLLLAKIKQIFEKTTPTDIFRSPILVGIAVLSVYALGNLVEMFGEIFLVRAAAGLFWAMSFPIRNPGGPRSINNSIFVLKICAVPFLIIFNVVKGFFGYTSYETEIRSSLTDKAKSYYDKKIKTESKVDAGIACPVGNNAETSWKHLVDLFNNDVDKMWARRSIGRVKDVLAITTALIIVFIGFSVVVSLILQIPQPPRIAPGQVIHLKQKTGLDRYLKKLQQHPEYLAEINTAIEAQDAEGMKRIIAEDYAGGLFGVVTNFSKRNQEIRQELKDMTSEMLARRFTEEEKEAFDKRMIELQKELFSVGTEMRVQLEGRSGKDAMNRMLAQIEESRHSHAAAIIFRRLSWVFLIGLMFLYTYQAYFITQRNVIESLIETLAIKEESRKKTSE